MKVEFASFCEAIGLHNSMLVVAPHPDDETLGCGGLIAFAMSSGIDVGIVVVTDGSASHTGSRSWSPQRIAMQRKREITEALRVLGVRRTPRFLDLPDAGTPNLRGNLRLEAREKFSAIIDDLAPDVVLTTWRREPHCDHRFSYELTRDAMRAAGSTARCVEYFVWTYLIGAYEDRPKPGETASLQLDIDEMRERKRAALAMHASQLGRLIQDDPGGFALTRAQMDLMTDGDEQFEVERAG
jgi:LmbE family N-acetylglucosaminyl deacetylase